MEALWDRLIDMAETLIWGSAAFGFLAIMVRRGWAIRRLRRQWPEIRLNLIYFGIDAIAVLPLAVLWIDLVAGAVSDLPIVLFSTADYATWSPWAVLALAILVADFTSYLFHRVMHSRLLWPVHAIHHSDRAMTWTSLMRFHPLNRLIKLTAGITVMTLIGMPAYAIAIANTVRHIYGLFIHADLPWTFGPLKRVFVSPMMHRWHHCRDERLAGRNFATIFAFFDVAFGTWAMPEERPAPAMGIYDRRIGRTWIQHMIYPLRVWFRHPASPRFDTQSVAEN